MSEVEEALRGQKKVWRRIIQEIRQGKLDQSLPPKLPRRILFFGVGSSLFSAKLSSYVLIRESMKKNSRFSVPVVACSSTSIGVEVIPQQGDWVFAFSHRAKTPVTLDAMEKCRRVGAFTFLVAARGASYPDLAQLVIPTSDLEKCEPHTVGMTSAICATTGLLARSEVMDSWEREASRTNPNLSTFQKNPIPAPTLLLGEWEAEWVAREISLKLTEMAGLRVPVYGTEEFFHGPSVLSKAQGEQEKIWFISHSSDPRAKELSSNSIAKFSMTYSLGWVPSLVELQWRVLALALQNGKNPDGV